jgi:hypothetical protein
MFHRIDWTATIAVVPQLQRGKVWCHTCGREQAVDTAHALRHGWPPCCGHTMSLDTPEERAARASTR